MSSKQVQPLVEDDYYVERMNEILDAFPNNGPTQHPVRLSDHIYIGNQENADDVDMLRAIGVTHVLNCTDSRNFDFSRSPYKPASGIVAFLMIPAEDFENYDIMQHFMDGIAFLDKAKMSKGIAFVHCTLGVNRSGAMVAAYLMVDQKRKLLDVIRELKSRRPLILSNPGFRRQLVRFARCRGLLDQVIEEHAGIEKFRQSSPLEVKQSAPQDENTISYSGIADTSERKIAPGNISKDVVSKNGFKSDYAINGQVMSYVNGKDFEWKNNTPTVRIGDHHTFHSVYEDDTQDTSSFTNYSSSELYEPTSMEYENLCALDKLHKFNATDEFHDKLFNVSRDDFEKIDISGDLHKFHGSDDCKLQKFNVPDEFHEKLFSASKNNFPKSDHARLSDNFQKHNDLEYKGDLEYTGVKYSPAIAADASIYYLPESPRFTPLRETPSSGTLHVSKPYVHHAHSAKSYSLGKPKSSYQYSDLDLDDFNKYDIDLPNTTRYASTPRSLSVPRIVTNSTHNGSYLSGTQKRISLDSSMLYENDVLHQPQETDSDLDDFIKYDIDLPRPALVPRIASSYVPSISFVTPRRVDLSPSRIKTDDVRYEPLQLDSDLDDFQNSYIARPITVPRIPYSTQSDVSISSGTSRCASTTSFKEAKIYTDNVRYQPLQLNSDLDDVNNSYDVDLLRPISVPRNPYSTPSTISNSSGTSRRVSSASSRIYTADILYQPRPYFDKSTAWESGSYVTQSSTPKYDSIPSYNTPNNPSTSSGIHRTTLTNYTRPQAYSPSKYYPKRTFYDDLDELDTDFASDASESLAQYVRTRVTAPPGRRVYSKFAHRW